jgi:pectate lyase-like protein
MPTQPTAFSDKQIFVSPEKDALQIINQQNRTVLGWIDGSGQAQGTLASPETNVLNALDFGATGNGVTDDTAAVQAALLAATTAPTATVWFPAGIYRISQIVFTAAYAGVRLLGSNSSYGSSYRAQFQATTAADMFTTQGNLNIRNLRFENLTFNGNNEATSGIYLDTCISAFIQNCEFINFSTVGVKGGSCLYLRVDSCLFHGSTGRSCDFQNGYGTNSAATYYGSNDGWFTNNADSTNLGMRVGGDNYFLYNDFELTLNTPALAALDLSDASTHAGNAKAVVEGNYFELVPGTCAVLTGIFGCVGMLSCSVTNNTLFGGSASFAGVAINLDNSYVINMSIHGNSIRDWGTGIKFVQGNGGGTSFVAGNYIENTVTTPISSPSSVILHGATNPPPQMFVLRGGIYMLNAPWIGTQVKMPSGTTVYDLSAGSQIYAQDAGATTVTGVTGAVAGMQFYITASTANTTLTNGSSAFVLKAGANYTMSAGQTLAFIVTADGIVREIGASA